MSQKTLTLPELEEYREGLQAGVADVEEKLQEAENDLEVNKTAVTNGEFVDSDEFDSCDAEISRLKRKLEKWEDYLGLVLRTLEQEKDVVKETKSEEGTLQEIVTAAIKQAEIEQRFEEAFEKVSEFLREGNAAAALEKFDEIRENLEYKELLEERMTNLEGTRATLQKAADVATKHRLETELTQVNKLSEKNENAAAVAKLDEIFKNSKYEQFLSQRKKGLEETREFLQKLVDAAAEVKEQPEIASEEPTVSKERVIGSKDTEVKETELQSDAERKEITADEIRAMVIRVEAEAKEMGLDVSNFSDNDAPLDVLFKTNGDWLDVSTRKEESNKLIWKYKIRDAVSKIFIVSVSNIFEMEAKIMDELKNLAK